jgi:hypothetical protein
LLTGCLGSTSIDIVISWLATSFHVALELSRLPFSHASWRWPR